MCLKLLVFFIFWCLQYSKIYISGVIIGDMGSKIGLNGLDNGWLKFNNYQIDRNPFISIKYGNFYFSFQSKIFRKCIFVKFYLKNPLISRKIVSLKDRSWNLRLLLKKWPKWSFIFHRFSVTCPRNSNRLKVAANSNYLIHLMVYTCEISIWSRNILSMKY